MSIYKEPPPGMCIVPDPDDLTKVPSRHTTFVGSAIVRFFRPRLAKGRRYCELDTKCNHVESCVCVTVT